MKRIICLLICIFLLCGSVFATEEVDLKTQLEAFLQENGLDETNFSMCYYNLSTGESYAFHDTAFLPVGTVWTLPLHMYYYEQESMGAFDPPPAHPEEVYTIGDMTLEDCRYHSILRGDESVSEKMREQLGTLERYQDLVNTAYGHIDDEALPPEYSSRLYYSAEFLINCLKELSSRSEVFGALTQNFKLVQPSDGFAGYGKDYTLVHILGEAEGMLCDVGIITAPQPYLLVCFTSAEDGRTILAQLNALVCGIVEQQAENTAPTETTRSTARSDSDFVLASANQNDRAEVLHLIVCILGVVFALAGIVGLVLWLVHRRREKKRWEGR